METIRMGNDEFILYIRKNYDCKKTNDVLGKEIWLWIEKNDQNAKQIIKDLPCLWEKERLNVDGNRLPKTATQFEFNRDLLPKLYNYLDFIGVNS